jgi:hypothetical protein
MVQQAEHLTTMTIRTPFVGDGDDCSMMTRARMLGTNDERRTRSNKCKCKEGLGYTSKLGAVILYMNKNRTEF